MRLIDLAEGPFWAGANLTFTFGLIFSAVAWFLFVDRTSLPKAPTRPKDTIEARWSERAASATYRDMLLLLCAATLTAVGFQIFADTRLDVPLLVIGPVLTLLAALDHQLRYALLKRAEG